MLRDLNLRPVYQSGTDDLIADLIDPLMANSSRYFRGVGYFSSGWLREASKGIVALVENGGSGRIITSPILNEADWSAFQAGDEARLDDALKTSLRVAIDDLESSLTTDTLNSLAWLIADGLLDFRLAIPKPGWKDGDYHDKVWVFRDTCGDRVALHGSFNDSVKGTLNGEGISVFCSWHLGQLPYVEAHERRLGALWDGENIQFETRSIPDTAKDALVQLRTTEMRPYRTINPPPLIEPRRINQAVTPRPFQDSAISEWEKAGRNGILAMATGTGKTFTSLTAAVRRYEQAGQVAVVILVPYLHLVEQWRNHASKFGFDPILCSGSHAKWRQNLRSKAREFRIGLADNVCVIAVHQTAAGDDFRDIVATLPVEHTLIVGDEVHMLGAMALQPAMLPAAGMHLGLSATPKRWFDPVGTDAVMQGFGDIVYEFGLEEAIAQGFLTPYDYEPELIELTDDEADEYSRLSLQIARLAGAAGDRKSVLDERSKWLLLQRAKLVWGAEGKLPRLLDLLSADMREASGRGTRLTHTLVYCAPGEHREVLKAVSGLGLRCHEFVHTVSMLDRSVVLERFDRGDIEVLIAVSCLDQGVDVPATRKAYFLASTTNPMQFVQRRGRILRLSPGKHNADLVDFVVVPPAPAATRDSGGGLGLLRREMPRFSEFSRAARNCFAARAVIFDLLDQYECLDMLEIDPWDLYSDVLRTEGSSFVNTDPLFKGE